MALSNRTARSVSLTLSDLDSFPNLDHVRIRQEIRVGRFELLEQRDGVVELAELEHVADRGGRPLGILGAGLTADDGIDQRADQEDSRGRRGGDQPEPT